MTLRRRFTLVIGSLFAALFLAYGLSLAWVQQKSLQRAQTRANEEALRRLAVVCQESLFSHDEIMLVNYFKNLQSSPGLRWGMFVREDGRIAVHTEMARKNTLVSPLFMKRPGELIYRAPVYRKGRPAGEAWLAFDKTYQRAELWQSLAAALKRFSWVTFFSLAAGLAVAGWAAKSLAVPIDRLAAAARRLGEGDWGARVEAQGDDELARLAKAFNDMSGKLARLDSLKDEFVATVSHDLRNPLGAITMISQYLKTARVSDETRIRMSANLLLSAQRLRAMVENNLDAAKIKERSLDFRNTPFSLADVLREVYDLYRFQADECGQLFDLEAEALPLARGDDEKTHRVVTNLVANAFKFTSAGDRITLRAAPEGENILVTVQDTGPGISAEDRARLFHRFRTAEAAPAALKKRQGTGLGLAIAKALVEGQGGRIWVESQQGGGTAFHFTLARIKP